MLIAVASTTTSPPTTVPPEGGQAGSSSTAVNTTVSELARFTWDALGDNGYQTGCALLVATVAVVVMTNLRFNYVVIGVIGVGSFWAGWLGWNTFAGESNLLFPGDIKATKLWDIGFASDTGFLVVAIVASVVALVLWRVSIKLIMRVILTGGAVLGASLVYNVYESLN